MSLVVLLAMAGCSQWIVDFQDPEEPCSDLRASQLTVAWYDAPLGAPAPVPVEVHHGCEAPARVRLSVDAAPFAVSPDHLLLGPGESAVVEVHFAPRDYEDASGTLTLDAGARTLDLPLFALADVDRDDDGYKAEEADGPDCDDLDPRVFPTALEVRNATDDDCNGLADEGFLVPGDLLLTELWGWGAPWAEVRNTTDLPVELGGWTLQTTGGTRTATYSTLLEAGALTVVHLDLPLDPTADTLTLWLGDEAMATVRWDTSKAVTEGASLSLDPFLESLWRNPDAWCVSDPPTPGGSNFPCPPRDLDGDQWTVHDGDCDDGDPDTYPGATELWDWHDRDCNGAVDDAEVMDVAYGWADGGTVARFNDDVLAAADHDGDGTELLFRVFSGDSTWILAVEGADVDGLDADYDSVAEVRIELEESPALDHYTLGTSSDVDGDGMTELVVHQISGSIHVVPGSALGAEATVDDASLQVSRGERTLWAGALGPDLDADGEAELVFFSKADPDEIHLLALQDGSVEVADAALTLDLGTTTVVAGETTWADWTGDGVDDLGACVAGTAGPQVLILEGGASLLEAESLASVTYARVEGCEPTLQPMAADLDGDGQVDLALTHQGATSTQVLAFLHTPSLGGTVTAGSADITLDSDPPSLQFASSLTTGDLDGDGAAELIVGTATRPGAVHVFCGATLEDGTTASACRSLGETGPGPGWALGTAVSAADLDGDGLGDVSVLAPDFGSGGRVWFVLSGGAL